MLEMDAILGATEQVNIEAKLAKGGLPKSVWETYSSFANSFGGIIVLGLEEEKKTKKLILRGVSDPEKMIIDIWNILNNPQKISNNILLENHVYSIEYHDMYFVIIEVPRADRRDKPIYIGRDMFKGSFRRNNEGDYHCKRDEVLAMLRDQAIESVDTKLLDNLALSDLNTDSIYRYRMIFKNRKPEHLWTKLGDEEFLVKIGAARKGEDKNVHPTLAGLLFFGDFITITDELPNYFLDYRERLSMETRWSDRVCSGDGSWSGNIFDFYFKIIDRLIADVKKPFRLDHSLARVDETNTHAALREILANSLIHADYYGRCGIVIDKEFRKITFSNPGTFRIGVETAISGGISDARNSRIFNMFSLIDVGERSGSGLCDVFHIWEENGYKRPSITEALDPDRITFSLQIEIEGNEGNYEGNRGNFEGNEGNYEGNRGNFEGNESFHREEFGIYNANPSAKLSKLSVNETLVLYAITENPVLSAAKISERIQISKSSVERALKSLKVKKLIRREGSTRGRWIIL